jgi:NADPH2:quinone reductase
MKTHAIVLEHTGEPANLRWREIALPPPGAGEVRVRHAAIGLNFIDTYVRSGLYPTALPAVLGAEAAGVVEELGEGVGGLAPGDRVAYGTGPVGAYAEKRNVPAAHLVKVPDAIDLSTAAAIMLKGMTAEYLVRRTYRVKPGDTILVHAAAGGVGLLLTQWAKHLGATVIGTVGSESKAALARAHGCDHVVFYRTEDVAARVRELTGGRGVPVVYDSVGRDTFAASLASLDRRGLLCTFGQSSGPIPPFDPRVLAQRGSLFLTRPSLGDYVATREELLSTVGALFEVIASGALRVRVDQTYPLRDAERAHRDLEARKTTGSTLLLP